MSGMWPSIRRSLGDRKPINTLRWAALRTQIRTFAQDREGAVSRRRTGSFDHLIGDFLGALLLLRSPLGGFSLSFHAVEPGVQALAALVEFVTRNSIGDDPPKHRGCDHEHQSTVGQLIIFRERGHVVSLYFFKPLISASVLSICACIASN